MPAVVIITAREKKLKGKEVTKNVVELDEILSQSRCHSQVDGVSKKRVLTIISECLASEYSKLNSAEIFSSLMARERLGSTGLGGGIAIPHCRVPFCSDIVGMLLTLEKAVDFDAIDGKPVDIVFVLIVPEQKTDEHIKTLAKLAELFSDEDFCLTLRNTQDSDDLYHVAITY